MSEYFVGGIWQQIIPRSIKLTLKKRCEIMLFIAAAMAILGATNRTEAAMIARQNGAI